MGFRSNNIITSLMVFCKEQFVNAGAFKLMYVQCFYNNFSILQNNKQKIMRQAQIMENFQHIQNNVTTLHRLTS